MFYSFFSFFSTLLFSRMQLRLLLWREWLVGRMDEWPCDDKMCQKPNLMGIMERANIVALAASGRLLRRLDDEITRKAKV